MTHQATIVGVRELRGKLGDYLRRAAAGERFTVVSRGKTLAELSPPPAEPIAYGDRAPGAMKGEVWIADDFDDWDPETQAAMDKLYDDDPRLRPE